MSLALADSLYDLHPCLSLPLLIVLKLVVGGIGLAILGSISAEAAQSVRRKGNKVRLFHGWMLKGLFWLGALASLTIVVGVVVYEFRGDSPVSIGMLLVAVFFAAMFAWPVLFAPMTLTMTPRGLHHRGWFGSTRMAWEDVAEVWYSQVWGGFGIRSRDNRVIRTSKYLGDSDVFKGCCQEWLPTEILNKTGWQQKESN